jgi:hypothetical protein
MSPEDIAKRPSEVLHDEDDNISDVDKPATPSEMPEIPATPVKDPAQAIDASKELMAIDPSKVPVTKFNDKYYVSYADLKNYMNNSDTSSYGKACNDIIKANPDAKDLSADTMKVVLRDCDLANCTPAEKAQMEASDVSFEYYK